MVYPAPISIYHGDVFLGEGPCWHGVENMLYWVDIPKQRIHRYDPKTIATDTWTLPYSVGAVVPRKSGGLVAATGDGFYFYDPDTERITEICNPERGITRNRFNDGKCDPSGRFWAGTMGGNKDNPTGALYRLDADLSCHKMISDVAISNGLAWTKDRKTFYYNDSVRKVVMAYDYDDATGDIENPRAVIKLDIDTEGAVFDGMTIDENDHLWIACWEGYQLAHWDPKTGTKLGKIDLPVPRVTSAHFGGDEMNELFITTGSTEDRGGGDLYHVKVDVRGFAAEMFLG